LINEHLNIQLSPNAETLGNPSWQDPEVLNVQAVSTSRNDLLDFSVFKLIALGYRTID